MKYTIILFVLAFVLGPSWGPAQDLEKPSKIDSSLLTAREPVACLIVLREQADLSRARALDAKSEKGRSVFRTLRKTARRSQASLRALLQNWEAPYRSFLIVNAIGARVDPGLLPALARRPEVARIQPNPWVRLDLPVPERGNIRLREDIEWGIRQIGADSVWALGYRGQGVVIGGQDTGYEWEHPALREQYRGWNGQSVDHNYHWRDAIDSISPLHNDSIIRPELNPCGLNVKAPCDDNNHGTHTMGIMVGDDGAGNQIGLAPGAQWIGVRNMERGFGSPATYLEGFEWFLAPTDLNNENPDPDRAPHVINNSWGCPPFEGCNPDNWEILNTAINNLRTAGIVVVASAGNGGESCSTVDDPPAIFAGSFSIGATDERDSIAPFSSRGPVSVDGSNRLKPNVVAPGVRVRSAVRNGQYRSFSGTSMSGPHVAGLVALMISANPELAGQVETIERIIEETALPIPATAPCSGKAPGAVPNFTYGYGRIDALAAVKRALQVTSAGNPVASAKVTVFPNPASGSVVFQTNGLQREVQLEIFDVHGRRLQKAQWTPAGGVFRHRLDISRLAEGFYFYRLRGTERSFSGRLVVR